MDDICNQYLDYLCNKCNKCYNFLLFSNRHLTVNMLIKLEISVPGMTHNGLAIKLVGLAERIKIVTTNVSSEYGHVPQL